MLLVIIDISNYDKIILPIIINGVFKWYALH